MRSTQKLLILLTLLAGCGPSGQPQARDFSRFGGDGDDVGNAVAVLQDGTIAIAGYSDSFGRGTDAYLIRAAVHGDTIWERTFGGDGDDFAWDVRETGEGDLLVAGFSDAPDLGEQVWVFSVHPDGVVEWSRLYGGPYDERAWAMAPTADGGAVIAAQRDMNGQGDWDTWLLRIDARGDTLWTTTWGGPGIQRALDVAVTTDGRITLTGFTSGTPDSPRKGFARQYDATGQYRWHWTRDGVDGVGHGILALPDGDVLFTGYGDTGDGNDNEIDLVELDPDGRPKWIQRFGGPGDDRAMMTDLVSNQTFLTVGYAGRPDREPPDWDIVVWRADREGRLVRADTLKNPGADRGVMVHPAEPGGFFLTGSIATDGAGTDVVLYRVH